MPNEPSRLNRIAVATDFSGGAAAALAQALWLGDRYGAEVTLVHVLTDVRSAMSQMASESRWQLVTGDIEQFETALRRKADERLAGVIAAQGSVSTKLSAITLLGEPATELVHLIQKEEFDLVVVGTRGLSAMKRFLIGSTAERLVRTCPCPVWVVRTEQPGALRSILAPVDLSPVSEKVLKFAASLAAQSSCPLHVVHVLEMPAAASKDVPELLGETQYTRYVRDAKRSLRKQLNELVASNVHGEAQVNTRLSGGDPWKVITSSVRRTRADLVVMGSVGRGGIADYFLGSTAEKVLRTCGSSVVTVKPDGFVSPVMPAFWRLHPGTPPAPGTA
jgi:nucleotide-binding universal stress UspA family protein